MTEPLRRLHPLTPLVRSAKTVGLLTAVVSYQSYQTPQLALIVTLAALMVVGGFLMSWVSWRFAGYRVTARELQIAEGVLARRHRTVPLERVQAVDVVRPLLARLLGLAEVRLEVVGKGDTEAPLAYLRLAEAEQLRDRLLALVTPAAGSATAAADTAPADTAAMTAATAVDALPAPPAGATAGPRPPAPAEPPLFVVDPVRLVLSQLLTVNALAVPVLAVYPVRGFLAADVSFATVFAALGAIAGLIQVPVRRVLNEWRFTLGRGPNGFRIHGGLLDTRHQTVPAVGIQALRIRQPLLWRPFGWVRVEIDVAGYSGGDPQQVRTGALVPVADTATAYRAACQVLPDLPASDPAGGSGGLDALPLRPAPARARWLAPLQFRRLGHAVVGGLLVTRHGWPTVRHDLALVVRGQSVRLSQGPLERAADLASVHLDLAGGQTRPQVPLRPVADALELVETLVSRGGTARSA